MSKDQKILPPVSTLQYASYSDESANKFHFPEVNQSSGYNFVGFNNQGTD
jgi:hypothetical protein